MRKPLVYVAGPITADPFGCVRQAAAVFPACRAAGVVPFLPQLSVLHEMVHPIGYDEWLAYDFDVIRNCEALLRLPGESPGADREAEFAAELGLPIFEAPADWSLLKRWADELHLRRCEDVDCDRVTRHLHSMIARAEDDAAWWMDRADAAESTDA